MMYERFASAKVKFRRAAAAARFYSAALAA